MADVKQTYANHVRWDPVFHFLIAPVVAITAAVVVRDAFRAGTATAWWMALVAVTGVVAVFKIRLYALRVQDRVIRLEERLRLMQVLPEPLRGRIAELRPRQLVALRFASDAELPALVERCLSEQLETKQIKLAIKEWRADYLRV